MSGSSLPPTRDGCVGPGSRRATMYPSSSQARTDNNVRQLRSSRDQDVHHVSSENNRRIVLYLRKRLHQRQRTWLREKKDPEREEKTDETQVRVPEQIPEGNDLFSRYTEIGGRTDELVPAADGMGVGGTPGGQNSGIPRALPVEYVEKCQQQDELMLNEDYNLQLGTNKDCVFAPAPVSNIGSGDGDQWEGGELLSQEGKPRSAPIPRLVDGPTESVSKGNSRHHGSASRGDIPRVPETSEALPNINEKHHVRTRKTGLPVRAPPSFESDSRRLPTIHDPRDRLLSRSADALSPRCLIKSKGRPRDMLEGKGRVGKLADLGVDTRNSGSASSIPEVIISASKPAMDRQLINSLTDARTSSVEIELEKPQDMSIMKSDVSVETIESDEQTEGAGTLFSQRLLMGGVPGNLPVERKIITLYVSSTLSDMESERTILMNKVFRGRLRKFCKELGYELQVKDPHWGLKDVWTDDHSHADTCINTLRRCSFHSKGHFFIMMVGQKLGYQPLPTYLTPAEFHVITDNIRRENVSLGGWWKSNDLPSGVGSDGDDIFNGPRRRMSMVYPQPRQLPVIAGSDRDEIATAPSRRMSLAIPRPRRRSPSRSNASGDAHEDYDVMVQREAKKECDDNLDVMETWYKLDRNNVPPLYVLQNISSELSDFTSSDRIKKQRAKNQWAWIYKHILDVIRTYLPGDVISQERRSELFETLPERELRVAEDASMLALSRHIPDLRKNLQDFAAKDYLDLLHMKSEVDDTCYDRVQNLKYRTISNMVDRNNFKELSVRWHKDGISAQSDRNHALYLSNLAKTCGDALETMVEMYHQKNIEAGNVQYDGDLYEEVAQHASIAQKKCEEFYCREDMLLKIKTYLLSDTRRPLILHGESGIGKSSVIAKSIELVPEWLKSTRLFVVYRFLGITPASEDAHSALHSICRQISDLYDLDQSTIPEDFHGVVNDLEGRLGAASHMCPLHLFLDGLDELIDHDRQLSWIPNVLPEHAKLVLSTREEPGCTVLDKLKKHCPDVEYIELKPMTKDELVSLVNHRLSKASRTSTPTQQTTVMERCEASPNTLFVKLVLSEAMKWNSFTENRRTFLPDDLKKLINAQFLELEDRHGESLVRRALGYVTAARHGVSWSEFEDLLSLDDNVMNDVIAQHSTRPWRCPPGLLTRLMKDLEPWLSLVKINDVWLYRWGHQQFKNVATERYLNSRDRAPSYHIVMADYFMAKWAGKRKPYPGGDSGSDRLVGGQPLSWISRQGGDEPGVTYNLRKLDELPTHLLKSNQLAILKEYLLFDFEWTLAKLKATSFSDVTSDVQTALEVQPKDFELRLLSDVLLLSSSVLKSDPNQLASQLTGRLSRLVMEDKPRSVWETQKYPLLAQLLQQANIPSVPSLIPSVTCLAQPGGILYDLLAGHTDHITAVCVSADGSLAATASRDDTVKLWDLKTRRVLKTLTRAGRNVTAIHLFMNSDVVAVVRSNTIDIYRFGDRSPVASIHDFIDPVTITSAGKSRQYLVAFYSGSNVMRTWDLGSGCQLILEREFTQRSIHRDASLCTALQSHADKVLYAFRSDSRAHVINVSTGKKILDLIPPNPGASVTALCVSVDSFIVACRYAYMVVSEIHQLELFDIRSGAHTRSIKGCTTDVVRQLFVNKMSTHVVCVSPSVRSNSSEIVVWNLDTDEHKHMAKHPQLSFLAACVDLTFFLTASTTDKVLKIWNIRKRINKRDPSEAKRGAKQKGVCKLIPMMNNPRYVVAKTHNNGPISVWNVVKGKCFGSAVRIERGLTDLFDVVLVRNDRVVILSDRREVTDDKVAVYQTVYIYNLKTKKFVRKVSDTFIVPSPADEYYLLEGELLMGLSESRDHLIVWGLENGQIKFRIKRNQDSKGRKTQLEDVDRTRKSVNCSSMAVITPWDIRSETDEAKEKRRQRELENARRRLEARRLEKDNPIEQYRLSRDESTVVCSYFAHHFNVFRVSTQTHLHTLEMNDSVMYLYNSKMTTTGLFLVHSNYNDAEKTSYITVWDLKRGVLKKRLKNEPNVCCIGMNETSTRVVFGNDKNALKVWDIRRKNSSLRKLKAPSDCFRLDSSSQIFIMGNGDKALIFTEDLLLFNLNDGTHIATFTPDLKISCIDVVLESQMIVIALNEASDVITLRLKGKNIRPLEIDLQNSGEGEELFGETTGDSTEDEDEEGDDGDEDADAGAIAT